MSDPAAPTYDIFISYAHADASTDEGEALIREIKESIEKALQDSGEKQDAATGCSRVFLDSEALKWGVEWNAEIRKCLQSSKVFVYLLSPNYLKSDYCQREKLWWAKQEIDNGRLNKGVRPIYYIRLNKTGDPKVDEYIKELKICQAHDQPFFESLNEVKKDIEQAVLNEIAEKVQSCLDKEEDAAQSFSSIHPPISRCFVGRLNDLAKLNDLVFASRRIPIITGGPGVGKSELAVAYACAYAESFPQGRFLIPMENVKTWDEAMTMLVEWCKVKCDVEPKDLGLPDDFDTLSSEEKKRAAYKMLANRAEHGSLLVLLDNLQKNNLNLISEEGLLELNGTGILPDNLHMIGTTRIQERIQTGYDVFEQMDIVNLTEKDAIEFFCRVSEDIFPFAKYPMSDGKLLLIDQANGNASLSEEEKERINLDYSALKKLIEKLEYHAWSLEIVAGRIISGQRTFNKRSFQEELKWIQESGTQSIYSGLIGKQHRTTESDLDSSRKLVSAEMLLAPTFEQILHVDEYVKGEDDFGQKIIAMAEIASFFPPEQVPEEALIGIWKQLFGEGSVSYDDNGCPITGKAYDFAINELKRHRIINGEGPLLKMHRITRDVLLDKLNDKAKVMFLHPVMGYYMACFLEGNPNPRPQQLLPWCGWANEWLCKSEVLQEKSLFLETLLLLAESCMSLDMYEEAEKLITCNMEKARTKDKSLAAKQLACFAKCHAVFGQAEKANSEQAEALEIVRSLSDEDSEEHLADVAMILMQHADLNDGLNHSQTAEKELQESLQIRRELAKKDPEDIGRLSAVAEILNNLSNLHQNLNRLEEAEKEIREALEIDRKLANKRPEKYLADVARNLYNQANLHFALDRVGEAEDEYRESLEIFRDLAKKAPEKHLSSVAISLNNLATLHKTIDRVGEAEKEFRESLEVFHALAEKLPEKYLPYVAMNLENQAGLHFDLGRTGEAEKEMQDALKIFRDLAEKNSEIHLGSIAACLTSLATLHKDLEHPETAEKEIRESLEIYRDLAGKTPEKYLPFVATSLGKQATLHFTLERMEESEKEYRESLEILRDLAGKNPEKYLEDVAMSLHNIAILHGRIGRNAEAEKEFRESLEIFRDLEEKAPEKYLSSVAKTLDCIAKQHQDLHRCEEAEKEFRESLEIFRDLAKKAPEKYLAELARSLKRLARLHDELGRGDEAEKEFQESKDIYLGLVERFPERDEYSIKTAAVLNSLADLHTRSKRCEEAEKEYLKSSSIYREFSEKYPDNHLYLADYAMSQKNLAHLHCDLCSNEKAEEECTEALEAYRKLAEDDPEQYLEDVALSLQLLASIHYEYVEGEKAEKETLEMVQIFSSLAEQNPEKYLSKKAINLGNLASVRFRLGRYDEATENYSETLSIWRDLSIKSPGKYVGDYADSLTSFALLHKKMNKNEDAEAELKEAIGIYRELAKNDPECYLDRLAKALIPLAILHNKCDCNEESEAEFLEGIEIRRELAEDRSVRNLISLFDDLAQLIVFYRRTERNDEIAKYCVEIIETSHLLAERKQTRYKEKMDLALKMLITLNADELKKEPYYFKALAIFQKYAKENPGEYDLDMALILHHLGSIAEDTKEKEKYLSEALVLYRKLADDEHHEYDLTLADILFNLSDIHRVWGPFDLAQKEEREAQAFLEGTNSQDADIPSTAYGNEDVPSPADEHPPATRQDAGVEAGPGCLFGWLAGVFRRPRE